MVTGARAATIPGTSLSTVALILFKLYQNHMGYMPSWSLFHISRYPSFKKQENGCGGIVN